MPASLRILHLEDDPEDTLILRECLADAGITGEFERVETREQFLAKLKLNSHDLVFADVLVPKFDGLQALSLYKESGGQAPFIFISGQANEDFLVESLRRGAADYVSKNNLSRLPQVVQRALREAEQAVALNAADTEREQMMERLQALSRRLIHVQETERRHLARELHDEIGQTLTAAKISLQSLQQFPDPANLSVNLSECIAFMDRFIAQIRSLSLDLRPPVLDDLGLVPALRWLVQQHGKISSAHARLEADPFLGRFDPSL